MSQPIGVLGFYKFSNTRVMVSPGVWCFYCVSCFEGHAERGDIEGFPDSTNDFGFTDGLYSVSLEHLEGNYQECLDGCGAVFNPYSTREFLTHQSVRELPTPEQLRG